ncbi:Ger(x)C family spore germination protein [Paenibacillus wynnii]|uniref:Ger(x)C family spore germination protein n=1 Tax=Paenibacillus wynnii TaxID=268407 RepID=UPI00279357FF|nr:Ger(x)C family spore germination protein [Paenibacillus wynnii]MDQ0194618.1 spore germination protein [Paenibacillus wynnii]
MSRLLAAIIMMCMLTGCGTEQRILEDLGMIQTASYDLEENNKLRVTINMPVSATDSTIKKMLLTAVTDSSKEARLLFSNQTELTVVSGQVRNTLFGLDLAKAGIHRHVDTLLRDTSMSLGVKVTIINGKAGELLSKNYKQHSETGQYINRMLEKRGSGNGIMPSSLYQFTRDYHDDGIDPIAPIVKDTGEDAEMDGIALFQDDRYMMKIPAKKALIFTLFKRNLKQGEIIIHLENKKNPKDIVMLSNIMSKRKVKVHHLANNRFKVDISASIRGSVLEYTGNKDLVKKEQRHKIEEEISQYISSQGEQMIKDMQKNKVDSLGIGQYVRNSLSYAEWKSLNWRNVYPQVEVNCHAKVLIKNYGKYS